MQNETICREGHFLNLCLDCAASAVSVKSLEEVTEWWTQGVISEDVLDGYRHVWAISAARSKTYDHWMALPATEEGKRVAFVLSALLPSGRGYC